MSVDALKDAIKEKKQLTIGKETTLKALKQGKLEQVYLASNAQKELLADVTHYTQVGAIACEQLNINAEELGVVCKKPFLIQIVGIKKAAN